MSKPYEIQDKYFRKAKELKVRARSYFKLEEVDQKFRLIHEGDHLLDLGAAPGSFSQYALKRSGAHGYVLAVDLQAIDPISDQSRFESIKADLYDDKTKQQITAMHPELFDGIISDLAPATSGVKSLDHWDSIELSYEVRRYAMDFVKKGGYCVVKVFQGEDFDRFVYQMKKTFEKVSIYKPAASRDRSKEVYVIGLRKKR